MTSRQLTSFQTFESLFHLFLRFFALFELLNLHLLAELLAFALFTLVFALFYASGFVQEALSYPFHVRVALDHLRKIIRGTGKWEVVFGG